LLLEAVEAVANAAVPDIAADADPHSAEQLRIHGETRREVAAVLAFEIFDDLLLRVRRKLRRRLDGRRALLQIEGEQTLISFEDLDVMARFLFDQRFDEGRNAPALELPVHVTGAKEPLRQPSRLFVDLHLE
jgi:hypothetical protein